MLVFVAFLYVAFLLRLLCFCFILFTGLATKQECIYERKGIAKGIHAGRHKRNSKGIQNKRQHAVTGNKNKTREENEESRPCKEKEKRKRKKRKKKQIPSLQK